MHRQKLPSLLSYAHVSWFYRQRVEPNKGTYAETRKTYRAVLSEPKVVIPETFIADPTPEDLTTTSLTTVAVPDLGPPQKRQFDGLDSTSRISQPTPDSGDKEGPSKKKKRKKNTADRNTG